MNNAANAVDGAEYVDAARLVLRDEYAFDVAFQCEVPSHLLTDASPPLGKGAGPDSEMLLAAAVANCLSASLAFALRKYKNEGVSLSSTASVRLGRNSEGRLRVQRLAVEIRLDAPGGTYRLLERALAQFEEFCVVTQAVRAAIPVDVKVLDGEGEVLKLRHDS